MWPITPVPFELFLDPRRSLLVAFVTYKVGQCFASRSRKTSLWPLRLNTGAILISYVTLTYVTNSEGPFIFRVSKLLKRYMDPIGVISK